MSIHFLHSLSPFEVSPHSLAVPRPRRTSHLDTDIAIRCSRHVASVFHAGAGISSASIAADRRQQAENKFPYCLVILMMTNFCPLSHCGLSTCSSTSNGSESYISAPLHRWLCSSIWRGKSPPTKESAAHFYTPVFSANAATPMRKGYENHATILLIFCFDCIMAACSGPKRGMQLEV